MLKFDDSLTQSLFITYEPKIYGDANRDLEITAVDALMTLQRSVNKIEFDDKQELLCNVNRDSDITADDALKILQKAVNKISEF